MLSLKPLKKLFKKKNLKKIGIGLGVAAAALVTGGAIMGASAGVGPAAGIAQVAAKVGSVLGIPTAAAAGAPAGAATGAAAAVAPTVAGAATPGAATLGASTAAGAGTTGLAAGGAAGGGFGATQLGSSVLPSAVADSAATSALSTGAASPAFSAPSSLGQGLGLGLGTGPSGAFTTSNIFNPVQTTSRAGQAAGAFASPALSTVTPTARVQPTTPAAEARRPVGLAPGAESPNSFLTTPQGQAITPELGDPILGGSAGGDDQMSRFGLGDGLLQTAKDVVGAGADWFTNLNPMTQFALLRGIEGGLTEDPLVTADRLERKRFKSRRGPRFVNGQWVS